MIFKFLGDQTWSGGRLQDEREIQESQLLSLQLPNGLLSSHGILHPCFHQFHYKVYHQLPTSALPHTAGINTHHLGRIHFYVPQYTSFM